MLISYRLWQSWFNGDESVIGRSVRFAARPATVIGVMPPGFYFRNREIDIWSAMGLDPARDYRKSSGRYMMSVARLKPGVGFRAGAGADDRHRETAGERLIRYSTRTGT